MTIGGKNESYHRERTCHVRYHTELQDSRRTGLLRFLILSTFLSTVWSEGLASLPRSEPKKKRNLTEGKCGRAIFGTQTFGSQTLPLIPPFSYFLAPSPLLCLETQSCLQPRWVPKPPGPWYSITGQHNACPEDPLAPGHTDPGVFRCDLPYAVTMLSKPKQSGTI